MRYLQEFSVRRLRYVEPIMILGWHVHHLLRLFTLTHQYMTELVGVYSLTSWCTHKPTPPYHKMLKLLFEKQVRNTWKVLKCCGGGWRSVGQIMWKNEVLLQAEFLHTIKRRKAHWIGHIWCRNCLQRHVTEGKIEGKTDAAPAWPSGNKRALETERGSTRPHFVKNSLWRSYGPVI